MAAMATSESSAGPQTTSAINTSARTRVPAISRCVQTVFQRFLLVALGNRSCSAGASVADNPCSAAPLAIYHTSVLVAGTVPFMSVHMNTHYYIYSITYIQYYIYRHRESTE